MEFSHILGGVCTYCISPDNNLLAVTNGTKVLVNFINTYTYNYNLKKF